jgi:hypothetical protein
MAVVWHDAQMMAFLFAGTMLALRPRVAPRLVGIGLLLLATAVRDNTAAALPSLLLLIATRWLPGRRFAIRAAAGAAVCIALVIAAGLLNLALTDRHNYAWYRSTAVWDIAGTICDAEPMPDEQVRSLLAGTSLRPTHDIQRAICRDYTPRVFFSIVNGNHRVFDDMPDDAERAARRRVWWDLVRHHPLAYAEHRWAVTRYVLGLARKPLWEPVCQTFAANPDQLIRIHHDASYSWLQRTLGSAFSWLARTMVFRPWVYFVLGMTFFVYGLVRRDELIIAFMGSGLLYEVSFFIATSAPDYRYSAWMIACACLTGVLVVKDRVARQAV